MKLEIDHFNLFILLLVAQSIQIDENQSDRLNLSIIDLHQSTHEVQPMFDKQSAKIISNN